jgi:DNA-binding MarR family transcriptional regulator
MLHRFEAEGLLTRRDILVDGKPCRLTRATRAGGRAFADWEGSVSERADEVLDR